MPKTKLQHVNWLKFHYPRNAVGRTIDWERYNLDALRAIYVKQRFKMLEDEYREKEAARQSQNNGQEEPEIVLKCRQYEFTFPV